jgi:hypothetical protein
MFSIQPNQISGRFRFKSSRFRAVERAARPKKQATISSMNCAVFLWYEQVWENERRTILPHFLTGGEEGYSYSGFWKTGFWKTLVSTEKR